MAKKVLILGDQSEELQQLVQKLSENGIQCQVYEWSYHALSAIDEAHADLLIAATDPLVAVDLADKIHDKWQSPSFLIVRNAGDQTQASLRQHPGIIGVFYTPLNVEKLYERVIALFEAP